jgi:hypothetical protein
VLNQLHWLITLLLGCSLSYLAGRYTVQRVLIRKLKKMYLALLLAWADESSRTPLRGEKHDD